MQVREHIVLGYRVTEVVLGRADIDDELPLMVQFHGRGDQPHIPSGDHANTEPARLMLPWGLTARRPRSHTDSHAHGAK